MRVTAGTLADLQDAHSERENRKRARRDQKPRRVVFCALCGEPIVTGHPGKQYHPECAEAVERAKRNCRRAARKRRAREAKE